MVEGLMLSLGRKEIMLRTILIGSCVSVQGTFVRMLENGRMVIRVGDKEFVGTAIAPNTTKVA
jgi:hypothetical protein